MMDALTKQDNYVSIGNKYSDKKKYSHLICVDDIEARIEKTREELQNLINYCNYCNFLGFNDEILEMSQYLDKLIVTYTKNCRSDFINDQR